MALPTNTITFDEINSIVQDDLMPKLVDNITEKSALLSILGMEDRIRPANDMSKTTEGNLAVITPLRYQIGSNTEVVSDFDTHNVTPTETKTAARYTLHTYVTPIPIAYTDELKTSTPEAAINYLSDKMMDAELDMKKKLYTDIYSGSGSSIIGLNTSIGTGSYAGIDGSVETWWQSGVDTTAHTGSNMEDSTNASYVITLLQTGYKACKNMGETPNLILCSQDVFDILDNVAESDQYLTKGTQSRFEAIANLGFNTITWRGIPVVVDDTIDDTADPMYMLNTNYMTLYFHPDDNFKFHPFLQSINQLAKFAKISLTCQLAIENRRMFYRWSDLNN